MARIVALIGWLIFAAPVLAASVQVGGYTAMSVDSGHGTQVEYLTTGGKSYLWYPGNKVILEGKWKRQGSDICFAYAGNTYNPVTGAEGNGWECMSFQLYWGAVDERMKGDIFALQGRREVPFVLRRERTTLETLLRAPRPIPRRRP